MSWNFYGPQGAELLAFQVSPNKITINTQIGWYNNGKEVDVMDDSESETISFNSDGSFSFDDEGYNEFTQFNCCNALWSILSCLNEQIAKATGTTPIFMDYETILKQPSVFKVIEEKFDVPTGKGYSYDHKFTFELDGVQYTGENQFIKYVFLNNKILKKTWTMDKIANFTVHMMKYLYEAETRYQPKNENFLNVDQEIVELLHK